MLARWSGDAKLFLARRAELSRRFNGDLEETKKPERQDDDEDEMEAIRKAKKDARV